jgi:hypothetical protein
MQDTAAPAQFNNRRVLNRVGLNGWVANISEVSEQGHNVCYFDLSFSQAGDDGVICCRADSPPIVNFARRVHEGFSVEVGGELQQDSNGQFYLAAHYVNFQGGRK